MEDVNRADKSEMCLKPHYDACFDIFHGSLSKTELISLECGQNPIPTPVLDKPWKMSSKLISLDMCLKPHSDACFG